MPNIRISISFASSIARTPRISKRSTGPCEWWIRRGHRPPLVFTLEELRRSADIFTIELLDMKSHHRILFGEDVLAEISVPLHYHAIQVERELRTDWLRLRQAMLAAPKKPKVYLELMVSSFSAFAALFRHALIALGEAPAESKREAIDRIAQFAGADPAGFHAILGIREGKGKEREIDVEKTLNQYFAFVEAVTDKFDRQLDCEASKRCECCLREDAHESRIDRAGGLVVIALLVGGMYVGSRNQMVTKNETVKSDWAEVDVVLQRRADLIPNLVETVKGFAAQEQTVFHDIAAPAPRCSARKLRRIKLPRTASWTARSAACF